MCVCVCVPLAQPLGLALRTGALCRSAFRRFLRFPVSLCMEVRNGLLLLNLLLCNHHTLGDQIITRELRDTLFRHSGIAPGTEAMPTTRTILMMLLNRYSEPPGSPEHAGTIGEAVVVLRNRSPPAARRAQVYILVDRKSVV